MNAILNYFKWIFRIGWTQVRYWDKTIRRNDGSIAGVVVHRTYINNITGEEKTSISYTQFYC
jgi:hypothetical protein